ncbi:M48 family metallopeptidase [Clostridium sp. MSJ-11]|uniref:M48 family metallopeptidase n=1 Tax=Clostridium mobile TaxID=2841512 RepID=A0ABS6EFF3_9CLOT|nr:M48 family metallopeptidase [Clostridium mobile]MBU5483882.1 M48 family metallopeptidase [Clostridium mobile]
MKKSFYLTLTVFFTFIFLFVFSVRYFENSNMEKLKKDNSYTVVLDNTTKASIAKVSDKAIHYRKINLNIWSVNLILSFAIPIIFILSGLSRKLSEFVKRISRNYIIQLALFFIFFTLISCIITFPLDYYRGFVHRHNFGLSNQTFYKWFSNYLKGFTINTLITSIFIWVPYFIINKSPKRWWLYNGLLSIPVLMFVTFISPMYIDPLFNQYTPIQNKDLQTKIEEQLKIADISNSKVYQVNKSVDTKEMNAYMTGVFNSKRIVLWDTTINNLTQGETLSITAHEIGHYVMGDVWKSIVLGGALFTLVLYLVNKSLLWILHKWRDILGVRRIVDVGAMPLIILLLNIFLFLANPITNTYSRYVEREADRYALELTKDNSSVITSTIKLHENSLSLPKVSKIYEVWYYSHPSYYDRVIFAKEYAPWKENKPLKYIK